MCGGDEIDGYSASLQNENICKENLSAKNKIQCNDTLLLDGPSANKIKYTSSSSLSSSLSPLNSISLYNRPVQCITPDITRHFGNNQVHNSQFQSQNAKNNILDNKSYVNRQLNYPNQR